jgi:hypothetical protein
VTGTESAVVRGPIPPAPAVALARRVDCSFVHSEG